MLQIAAEPFADAALAVRARLLLDLSDPSARLVDATVRSQRSGSRRFAFRDGLIGFGAALRDVLLSWGVPSHAIFTNDTPVEGYFVGRKYWDFVVKDADGREQVLIENSRIGGVGKAAGVSEVCHGLLGAMDSVYFTGRRAFVGLVFVSDATRYPMTPRRRDRQRKQLERFDRTCRQAGLLDALTYIEVTPDAATEPSPALSLERFLWMLHRKLDHLPEAAWMAAGCGL